MIWERGDFLITSDHNRVDIEALHALLSQSYWARDRSRDAVEKTVPNSLCFSIFKGDEQIGFVRAITDGVTYAVILISFLLYRLYIVNLSDGIEPGVIGDNLIPYTGVKSCKKAHKL